MDKNHKPKILGMSSETYPYGRIDSFKIEFTGETEKSLISLFIELGFDSQIVKGKLQSVLGEEDYVFLFGNDKIKAHLFVDVQNNDFLIIRFDTNLEKHELGNKIEKYFDFP